MTREELLKTIDYIDASGMIYVPAGRALRAVVELHNPKVIPDWVPTKEDLICWCAQIYPCETIKAVEEGLKK